MEPVDPTQTPVQLAYELSAQLANGNRRLVRLTLKALPKAVGMAVVFYMRCNLQTHPDDVGSLRRLLDHLVTEEAAQC